MAKAWRIVVERKKKSRERNREESRSSEDDPVVVFVEDDPVVVVGDPRPTIGWRWKRKSRRRKNEGVTRKKDDRTQGREEQSDRRPN